MILLLLPIGFVLILYEDDMSLSNAEQLYIDLVNKPNKNQGDLDLLEDIQIELARNSFKFFCYLIRPHYKWQWFHKYIMERLQAKVIPITAYDFEYRRLLLRVGDQHGKFLDNDSLIKTVSGWMKIGDIKVGDIIDSGCGQNTNVTGVYPQGLQDLYRITFEDGRYVDCGLDHLWEIRCNEIQNPLKKIQVINTSQIMELRTKKKYRDHIYIPRYMPNTDNKNIYLPIDPYLLGALIADGTLCLSGNKLGYTKTDTFIIGKIDKLCNLYNAKLSSHGKDHNIINIDRKLQNPLKIILKNLLLSDCKSYDKFIPYEYLNASYAQRLQLVQGLMDGDDTIGKQSTIEYSTSSHQLALDMQYLIRSIGGLCTIRKISQPKYSYKGEMRIDHASYRLCIRVADQTILFSAPSKLSRCKSIHRRSDANKWLRIKDIKFISNKEATCIAVDHSRKLYTTQNFIVTHNTELAVVLFSAWCLGKFPNKQEIFLTYSDVRAKQPTMDLINVIITPTYKKIFPEFMLADEMDEVERQAEKSGQKLTNLQFTNANSPKNGKQGKFLGSSLGGSYLGNSGDIIICDDLFAGQKEANSQNIRDNKWELYSSSVMSRQQKDTVIILLGTWWNRDDIIGRIQNQYITNEQHLEPGTAKWELIEFNSQKDDRDYSYDPRNYGEYLWPEERMTSYLDQKQMNPAMWSIKHQNLPIDSDGILFKVTSFRIYDKLPTELINMKIIISIDSNYKVTKTSDYAGITIWAVYNMNAYLVEYINKKYTLPQLLDQAVILTKKYPTYHSILVEVKSQGQPFVDMAHLYGLSRVEGFEPQGKGSKWERAHVVLPIFDGGQVHIPNEKLCPNINFLVNQFMSFTGEDGKADDLVDTGTQMFMYYDYLFRGMAAMMPQTIPKHIIQQGNTKRLSQYKGMKGTQKHIGLR